MLIIFFFCKYQIISGDVSETIRHFFDESDKMAGVTKSQLYLEDVDKFLDKLCLLTKEDEQINHFSKFCKKCTANDLKTVRVSI